MSIIRWQRISECLADRGYEVDVIADAREPFLSPRANLRVVPYDRFDWSRYHVIKTLFHRGFESLCAAGGADHPFVISKLGSVVGSEDGVAGVHFFGREREQLFDLQAEIQKKSRVVTLLTEASRKLWEHEFGGTDHLLTVPTGVDRDIPPRRRNPYSAFSEPIAVYLGNIYTRTQLEVNRLWQARLNELGRRLRKKGIRLCLVGPGDTSELDGEAVTYLGCVHHDASWDYQYFADVGIVLAQGEVQHNESSKIYYYLRTGLPVVSEAPVPNNEVLEAAGLGLITDYADLGATADAVEAAVHRSWPREDAIRYVLEHHTWDRRVELYDRLLRSEFSR